MAYLHPQILPLRWHFFTPQILPLVPFLRYSFLQKECLTCKHLSRKFRQSFPVSLPTLFRPLTHSRLFRLPSLHDAALFAHFAPLNGFFILPFASSSLWLFSLPCWCHQCWYAQNSILLPYNCLASWSCFLLLSNNQLLYDPFCHSEDITLYTSS